MRSRASHDLPPELWLMVSTTLWNKDLKSLRLACTIWAQLFKARLLAQLVFGKKVQGMMDWVSEDYQASRTVRSVTLLEGVIPYLPELTALVSKGRLRALRSFSWRVHGHELPTLLVGLIDSCCPYLRSVYIGEVSQQSIQRVEGLKNLTSFGFAGQSKIILNLDRLVRANPGLSQLHIHSDAIELTSGCEFYPAFLGEIAAVGDYWTLFLLTECRSALLTSLSLHPTSHDFDWHSWLSSHLDHYPNLIHLHLTIDYNHPQRHRLHSVLPCFIARHRHLRRLLLNGQFDNQLARAVLKIIVNLPELCGLDIGIDILSKEMKLDLVSFLPRKLIDFTLRILSSDVPEIEWGAFLSVISSRCNLRTVGLEGQYLSGAKRLAYVVSKVMEVAPQMELMRVGTTGELKDFRITVDLEGVRRWEEFGW